MRLQSKSSPENWRIPTLPHWANFLECIRPAARSPYRISKPAFVPPPLVCWLIWHTGIPRRFLTGTTRPSPSRQSEARLVSKGGEVPRAVERWKSDGSGKWIRRCCLSFPHATEEVQWENHLLFKIGGKMFAIAPLEPARLFVSRSSARPKSLASCGIYPGVIPAPYLARAKWIALEREDAATLGGDQATAAASLTS